MKLLLAILAVIILAPLARANTVNAASCSSTDVQTAITSAVQGDTVAIPTCTAGVSWTSGVTVSGKGIKIQGAGSGRIIAYDNGTETLTVGTGTLTMTIAGYSPGFSAGSITNGETLRVSMTGSHNNWMQGTVTSLVGSTLTMNITSTGGSGTTHRWLVSTVPQTVLIDNSTTGPMFNITEDSAFHTEWSGIKIAAGTGTKSAIQVNYNSSGIAVLIHDCWVELFSIDMLEFKTNRGVVWNCSADGNSGNPGAMSTGFFVRIKIDSPQAGQNTWTQPSYWGTADTTGENNVYVENSDVHATQGATDNDDNGRMVWRYNLMDAAIFSTHGADSSSYGQRYFEYYNNTGNFNCYSDGTTFNMANGWIGFIRGGTFIVHDNNLPALKPCQDYSKDDIEMTVYNLQLNGGPNPCWGAGFSTGGQYYHAPRQVGFGRVTGTGTANYPPDGVNNSTTDSVTYVGDSEPAYIWSNNRTFTVSLPDYGGTGCTSPDHTSDYIASGRDYIIGTAKPGYTAYTYPHPLTSGTPQVATPTFSPSGGSYSSTQSVTISSTTTGATLCYTTDGTSPTANGAGTCTHGTTYSTAVSVASSLTLKAIGSKSGDTDSTIGSAAYTITSAASTPSCTPGTGSYSSTQTVSCSVATGPVMCWNTAGSPATDGASGCAIGTIYSGPITVSSSEVLYIIAGGTGYSDSSIASYTYTISATSTGQHNGRGYYNNHKNGRDYTLNFNGRWYQPPTPPASVAIDGHTYYAAPVCTDGSSVSCTITASFSIPTTGDAVDLIIGFCPVNACTSTPTGAVTVTDGTNTYTEITAAESASTSTQSVYRFVACNATAGTYTLVAHDNNGTDNFYHTFVEAITISGANSTACVDSAVSNKATGTGTAASVTSTGNVAKASEVAIAAIHCGGTSLSNTGTYSTVNLNTTDGILAASYSNPTQGSTTTAAATCGSSTGWWASLLSIQP